MLRGKKKIKEKCHLGLDGIMLSHVERLELIVF